MELLRKSIVPILKNRSVLLSSTLNKTYCVTSCTPLSHNNCSSNISPCSSCLIQSNLCSTNLSPFYETRHKIHTLHRGWSSVPNNRHEKSFTIPLVPRILCQMPPVTSCPDRELTRYGLTQGRMRSVRMVIARFRRLGNGLWLRKQSGMNKRIWRKRLKGRGPKFIYKKRRTLICNKWQSKLLDKMVTQYWKKQKWYVEDPYKGYTEETMFYYHPKELPWNTTAKSDDHFKYAVHRFNLTNKMRKRRKLRQLHSKGCHPCKPKPIPSTKNGFFFA